MPSEQRLLEVTSPAPASPPPAQLLHVLEIAEQVVRSPDEAEVLAVGESVTPHPTGWVWDFSVPASLTPTPCGCHVTLVRPHPLQAIATRCISAKCMHACLMLLDTLNYRVSQSSCRTQTGQNYLWTEGAGLKERTPGYIKHTTVATPTLSNG